MPRKPDPQYELYCGRTGKPLLVGVTQQVIDSVKDQAIPCPHCGQRHVGDVRLKPDSVGK